jgi:imidazolonepropionase-like amidohydrolase
MKSFMQIVEALNKNGIAVVAGTDMGFPGYSVCRELELYVAAGFTPMEAIRTATIIPAQVMRLESSLGSVDVGKNANLVILNDNPLEDIRNIRKVFGIVKDGQLLDPDELHKIAGFNKK